MNSYFLALVILAVAIILIVFSVQEYRHENHKASLITALLAVVCLAVSFSYAVRIVRRKEPTTLTKPDMTLVSPADETEKDRQLTLPSAMTTTVRGHK